MAITPKVCFWEKTLFPDVPERTFYILDDSGYEYKRTPITNEHAITLITLGLMQSTFAAKVAVKYRRYIEEST